MCVLTVSVQPHLSRTHLTLINPETIQPPENDNELETD